MPKKKGKHLNYDDRCDIEDMLKHGSSFREIARHLRFLMKCIEIEQGNARRISCSTVCGAACIIGRAANKAYAAHVRLRKNTARTAIKKIATAFASNSRQRSVRGWRKPRMYAISA